MADEEASKIIIDEGWKAQVEREKEESLNTEEAVAPADAEAGKEEQGTKFDVLVSYLASHAMGAMGMFAEPDSEEIMVNLELAEFIVDALMTLRDKTEGNLSPEEAGRLQSLIGDIQRAFVQTSQAVQQTNLQAGMGDAAGEPGIVMP